MTRRARIALSILGIAIGVPAAFAAYEWATWPDVARLAHENPASTAFIERDLAAARAAGRTPRVAWTWVPYAAIDSDLKKAVLVGEDIGFFWHHGFEIEEVKSALRQAWAEGEAPRGASTITQQLAKNLWLSPSRNPWRKAKEALLTRALERHLSKRRILEIYLNVVEFGPGTFGAEAAARHYFGKPASDLTALEAAELAGALPRPSSWHPGATDRGYRRHVRIIQLRMAKATFLERQI